MVDGELVFMDGTSLRGQYDISPLGRELNLLVFMSKTTSPIALTKTPACLNDSAGEPVVAKLWQEKASFSNDYQVFVCRFLEKDRNYPGFR